MKLYIYKLTDPDSKSKLRGQIWIRIFLENQIVDRNRCGKSDFELERVSMR